MGTAGRALQGLGSVGCSSAQGGNCCQSNHPHTAHRDAMCRTALAQPVQAAEVGHPALLLRAHHMVMLGISPSAAVCLAQLLGLPQSAAVEL